MGAPISDFDYSLKHNSDLKFFRSGIYFNIFFKQNFF